MVCKKCEKKLSKLACPDTWKEGSRNSTVGKGRPLATNGLVRKSSKKNPYSSAKCEMCKKPLHQQGKYCHGCAYSKGVCGMCGKQVMDTKGYRQSTT
eukprot:jgi/Ulvmu1/10759/UM068_0049.1